MIPRILARRWALRGEAGATSVEYGFLAAAVAALIVVVTYALGGLVTQMFGISCDVIELQATTGGDCGR